MKKIFAFVLMAAMLLSLVPAALAAGYGRNARTACTYEGKNVVCENRQETCGQNFADEDNDGVCDNRQEACGKHFVDENNDGVCDNRPEACGQTFADENNDGLCDNRRQNCQPMPKAPQGHHGKGHHGK